MKILKLDNSFFSWEKIGYLQLSNLHIITFCFHSDSLTWRSNQKKKNIESAMYHRNSTEGKLQHQHQQTKTLQVDFLSPCTTHPPSTHKLFLIQIWDEHFLQAPFTFFLFFFFLIGKVNPGLIYL